HSCFTIQIFDRKIKAIGWISANPKSVKYVVASEFYHPSSRSYFPDRSDTWNLFKQKAAIILV
ncbi:MAG: hypothetical protein AAGC85_12795, partial [Bacteroidota bacterium]